MNSKNLPLEFGLGKVRHNELDLDRQAPDSELSEDLLQVEYVESNLIVDVGWHKTNKAGGEYLILLIKDCDWEHPVMEKRVTLLPELRCELQHFLTTANEVEVEQRSRSR